MPPNKSILLVEDEEDLAELLQFNLQREGYLCRHAPDGNAAVEELRRQTPDLVVLDRMLPGLSGDEVITQLRQNSRTQNLPVIMLTAKGEEADELVGLTLGADDYITKPFSTKLLLARIAAVLRRAPHRADQGRTVSAGPIELDVSRHEVRVDGIRVMPTATEFRILQALMSASGRVLSREQLIDIVLGSMVAVTDRTIDVHIAALRKKLGHAATWIQTIRGVGYTLRPPEQ